MEALLQSLILLVLADFMLSCSEGLSPAVAEVGRRGAFHRLSPWPRISSLACPEPGVRACLAGRRCVGQRGLGRGWRRGGERSGVGSSGFLPLTMASALQPSPDSDNSPFPLPGPSGPAWERPPAAAGPQHFNSPCGPFHPDLCQSNSHFIKSLAQARFLPGPPGCRAGVAGFTGLGDPDLPAWHHDHPHPPFSYRSWF